MWTYFFDPINSSLILFAHFILETTFAAFEFPIRFPPSFLRTFSILGLQSPEPFRCIFVQLLCQGLGRFSHWKRQGFFGLFIRWEKDVRDENGMATGKVGSINFFAKVFPQEIRKFVDINARRRSFSSITQHVNIEKTHLIYKTRTSLSYDISSGRKRHSCKNSWCMNKYSRCSQGSSIFRRLFFAHVGICFLCASSRSSFEEKGSNFPRVRASEWKQ